MNARVVTGRIILTTGAACREMLQNYTSLPPLIHMLCLGSFLNRAGSFVMVFMTLYVSEQLQLGTVFATRCIGVFGIGSIFASLVGGHLSDAFGRRITLMLALFGGAAMLVVLSFVQTGWLFMSSVFLFALVMEMYRPAAFAMIGDVASIEQRSHAFGLTYIAVNLGFAVAPPIGGLLAAKSFQWLFWGDAMTTALFGVIVWLFLRETLPIRSASGSAATSRREPLMVPAPPELSRLPGLEEVPLESDLAITSATVSPVVAVASAGDSRSNQSDVADPSTKMHVPIREAVGVILRDHTFLLYCVCNLLTGMVFMQAFSTLPIYLRSLGFSELDYGMMICWNGILIVLLQMPMTHVLSRFNRLSMILLGELLLGVGFGLTAFAVSRSMVMVTIVLWTMGEIIQAPFKQAIVADLAPVSLRARYMGVFTVSHSLALAIGPPLGGQVLSVNGARYVWGGAFVTILLSILLYAMIFTKLKARSAIAIETT